MGKNLSSSSFAGVALILYPPAFSAAGMAALVACSSPAEAKPFIRGWAGQAGRKINKFAIKTGRKINREAINAGKGVEHLGQQVGNVFNRLGGEVEKGLCDIFDFGGGCSVSAGAGYDDEGPYTYDPTNPDVRYRPGQSSKDPDVQRLIESATYLRDAQIQTWEFEDGVERFMLPDTVIGEAWPNAERELKAPTASGTVRPCGGAGCGGFLSPRGDPRSPGGVRYHRGVDYVTKPGEPIYAPMTGYVERAANPGKPGMLGLRLRNEAGYGATVFYVEPDSRISQSLGRGEPVPVQAGRTVIGRAQNLHPAYPAAVPNHVSRLAVRPAGQPGLA